MRQYEVVADSFARHRTHAEDVVVSLRAVLERVEEQQAAGAIAFDPGEPERLKLLSCDDRYWASEGRDTRPGSADDVAALRVLLPLVTDFRDAFAQWDRATIARGFGERSPIRAPQGSEWLAEEPDPTIENEDVRSYWQTVRYESQRAWLQSAWRDQERLYEGVRPTYERFRAQLVPSRIYVLISILGGLILAGVFVPLFFLSARPDWWREALIAAFGVLALALVGYLLFEVRSLRRAGDLSRSWP